MYIFCKVEADQFESPRFAFYDTVSDNFVDFNGEQLWDSIEDFQMDARALGDNDTRNRRERCEALMQDWVPKSTPED